MMRIVLPIAAAAALVFCNVPSSRAGTSGDAPWCAVTENGGGSVDWECEFYSIQECRPHVISGNRGVCNLNPYWHGGPPPAGPYVKHHRSHHVSQD